MMEKLMSICFLSILILSCDPIIEVELPPHQPSLVVNGLIHPDDSIRIQVSSSSSIIGRNDFRSRVIRDAQIELREDGQLLPGFLVQDTIRQWDDLNSREVSFYLLALMPQTGSRYSLRVEDDSLGIAYAETTIPKEPKIKDVSLDIRVGKDANGNQLSAITFVLEDDPEQNFYEILCVLTTKETPNSRSRTEITPLGGLLPDRFVDEYTQGLGLLTDDLFNGKDHQVTLYFFTGDIGSRAGVPISDEIESLLLVVRSCDPSYYQYRKNVDAHIDIQENDAPLFPAEPLPVFSNIDGGFGIWGSYVSIRDTLL